ncbi:hypothetical protein ARMSODRAFT_978813 [Armillaria solidipes]|uniref:Uncharacterized protein n=1 Tax=Armillaria solidipes TaxID=1076256 RepID=A0A2H3BFP4_9AGAR|nr:hypothetical protein ARMSODRAFT_978813 [Armillaria solidipes]
MNGNPNPPALAYLFSQTTKTERLGLLCLEQLPAACDPNGGLLICYLPSSSILARPQSRWQCLVGSSVERQLTLEGSRIRPDSRYLALELQPFSGAYRSLSPFRRVVFSGTMKVDAPRRKIGGVLGTWFFKVAPLLLPSVDASAAPQVWFSECTLKPTFSLCSTSTECIQFITHLNFETDVGACGAHREMNLHRSRPVRRRVDGTTHMVGPAWDFWVYPPSITMFIMDNIKKHESLTSLYVKGSDDYNVENINQCGMNATGNATMAYAMAHQLGSSGIKTPFSYSSTIDRPEAFLIEDTEPKLFVRQGFSMPRFLDFALPTVNVNDPWTCFKQTLAWRKGGAEFGIFKVEMVMSMTMMAVEMEGRAWFNWESVLLLVVQFIMVIRFLEAAGKLDVGIAFQQFQREPAGW